MSHAITRVRSLCAAAVALLLPIPGISQTANPIPEWTTERADAQRSGWLRTDAYISPRSMSKPGFRLLWHVHLGKPGDTSPLSEPVTFSRFSGERGWKTLVSLGSRSNTYYSVDNDLGTVYLDRRLSDEAVKPGTASCPGGMTSALSRPVNLIVSEPQGRAGAMGPIRSGVGAPDQGAPADFRTRSGGRGGPGLAAGASGRGAIAGGGRGSSAGAYALTSDGMLRTIGKASGLETSKPVQFVSPGSFSSGLVVISDVAYVSTINGCGGAPDGIASMDLASPDKTTRYWRTEGGSPLGPPAFSEDGTLFVSVGPAKPVTGHAMCAGVLCALPKGFSNAVVALDPKSLAAKAWYSASQNLSSPPVVIRNGDREYVAVAATDGTIYLLDAAEPGGADRKTAIARTAPTGRGGILAAWRDSSGTAWILSSVSTSLSSGIRFPVSYGPVRSGAVVAWRLGGSGLEPAWVSANIANPTAPIIVNGVVFVAASGSATANAELLALDGENGKTLWSSGHAMTSRVDSTGLSVSQGQVYVLTNDHAFYTFGFPVPVNNF